jgi:polyferredoxin
MKDEFKKWFAGRNTPAESIAELADRKGTWPQITHNKTKWVVDIFPTNSEGEDESGECSMFYACVDTYPEAEAKARAFLSGLPDKKEGV